MASAIKKFEKVLELKLLPRLAGVIPEDILKISFSYQPAIRSAFLYFCLEI